MPWNRSFDGVKTRSTAVYGIGALMPNSFGLIVAVPDFTSGGSGATQGAKETGTPAD
jgi:hypothetical protein